MTEGGPPRPSGSESAEALAEVLADQRNRAERRHAPGGKRPPRWTGPLGLVVAILTVLTAWAWVAPPDFLRRPPLEAPSAIEQEAGARIEILAAASHVIRWSEERGGALPPDLATAWPLADRSTLVYQVLPGGDGFRIAASTSGDSLVYESSTPLQDWADGARHLVDGDVPRGP